MADQSDVETALAGRATAILYPLGPDGPSLVGPVCRIYRGWPNAPALDADLAAGVVNISVFSDSGDQRNTTRWLHGGITPSVAVPTLTVLNDASGVTFGGAGGAGQLAGVLADNYAAVHRLGAADTPGQVAAILAAMLRAARATVLSGSTISVPGANRLLGRVFADQPHLRETRRQRMGFLLTCWCPDPASRDAVGSALDAAISAQEFLPLPDGTVGRLRFRSSVARDRGEDAALYRRDLRYDVDYATTLSSMLPSMMFGDLAVTGGAGAIATVLS
jgi:hypothetical protein